MNNGYYPNNNNFNLPNQGFTPSGEQSNLPFDTNNLVSNPEYADNVFYINIGKRVSVYFSYPDSLEWRDKVFTGRIKAAGRDYLILTDDEGQDNLLWLIYINYARFHDKISIN